MNSSPQIGELAKALAAAQGEMDVALRESTNPFFKSKYADLASVWAACRAALSRHEIAVIQSIEADQQSVNVETTLAHSSGEWTSSTLSLIPKASDPQAIGSAITYGRRYGLAAMVGVAADDDDGNAASSRQMGSVSMPAAEHELKTIWKLIEEHGKDPTAFQAYLRTTYGIEHSRDIRSQDVPSICDWIRSGNGTLDMSQMKAGDVSTHQSVKGPLEVKSEIDPAECLTAQEWEALEAEAGLRGVDVQALRVLVKTVTAKPFAMLTRQQLPAVKAAFPAKPGTAVPAAAPKKERKAKVEDPPRSLPDPVEGPSADPLTLAKQKQYEIYKTQLSLTAAQEMALNQKHNGDLSCILAELRMRVAPQQESLVPHE